ncbi:hypothetical protein GCM10023086_47790 [Streptomyces venetus]|uniref:Uncharacterized protein n=2 Tax=Streptomyces venetus TaxID=1701086 RepID=A0ABP8GDT0_9ACTN
MRLFGVPSVMTVKAFGEKWDAARASDWPSSGGECFDPPHGGAAGTETRFFEPAITDAPRQCDIHAKGNTPMNNTPRVDIAELSDADLEQVSGGNAGAGASAGLAGGLAGGLSAGLVGPLTAEVCGGLQAALSTEGATAGGSAGIHTASL